MLTVICGGMFAEKTTELQRRGKRLERAGKKVLYVKPNFDTRYSENEIVTHDGAKVQAVNIDSENPYDIYEIADEYDAICIDEVQFFSQDIIKAINALLLRGKKVIVAGLDLDYKGEPFFVTTILMGYAEEVVKLHAVCSSCGADAWVSYKEDNGERIQLGTDEYKPMCRKCFNEKKMNGFWGYVL
jgi:thymidine kinase